VLDYFVYLPILGLAILYIYLKSPTVIGARGERRVNSTLQNNLSDQEYILFKDLMLPTSRGTTQIDHIVLSRYGIFVIETKNMSGWIFGGETQARWTQVMRRHKSQFQNPLRQNYHHVKVVQDLLGVRLDQIENLVVFVGSAKPKTEMPTNVFWNRRKLYRFIKSQQTIQFTDGNMRKFAMILRDRSLVDNKENRKAHIRHLHEKNTRKDTDITKCPRCQSQMVERKNRNTGQTFYGCSKFPECRGTRQVK
jgi:hypothetical protein